MSSRTAILTIGAALIFSSATGTASAAPAPVDCDTVLLVHDIASGPESLSALADDLRDAGRCVVTPTWGAPGPGDVPLPVAGVRGVDAGAHDLAAVISDMNAPGEIDVVAHGVGSLVVQRHLQNDGSGPIRSLTTLGPIWNGTEIGGLAAMEQFSRDLGTYDLILGLEKPLIDPVCAGCREVIRGSDLLRDLHDRGLPTSSVRYTDIVSSCDGLVVPAEANSIPGATVHRLQDHSSLGCTPHNELPNSALVRQLVTSAISAPDV